VCKKQDLSCKAQHGQYVANIQREISFFAGQGNATLKTKRNKWYAGIGINYEPILAFCFAAVCRPQQSRCFGWYLNQH
jgi:hypothetical protein